MVVGNVSVTGLSSGVSNLYISYIFWNILKFLSNSGYKKSIYENDYNFEDNNNNTNWDLSYSMCLPETI